MKSIEKEKVTKAIAATECTFGYSIPTLGFVIELPSHAAFMIRQLMQTK
jgi:hypothetical protein